MLRLSDLGLRAGAFRLEGISLEIGAEYFVLLGPTGAGKSLLLKCICGLIRRARGTIVIDGEDVTDLEPRRRKIGYVPQDYGLFPHLNVRDNVCFPLRANGMRRAKARAAIGEIVEILGIGPLLDRSTLGLSGGERQKVALGRALALRPRALLLDEPVSALDAPTRRSVCAELRRIQKGLGIPTLHVCHNLEEALSVADRAGVIRGGRLIQTGPFAELARCPATPAVARLLGAENVLAGTAEPGPGDRSRLSFAGGTILVRGRFEGPCAFMARPEMLRAGAPEGPNAIRATLGAVEDRGHSLRLTFKAAVTIVVYASRERAYLPGSPYGLEFPEEAVHVFPQAPDHED